VISRKATSDPVHWKERAENLRIRQAALVEEYPHGAVLRGEHARERDYTRKPVNLVSARRNVDGLGEDAMRVGLTATVCFHPSGDWLAVYPSVMSYGWLSGESGYEDSGADHAATPG
jgi:hypothetical protein